MPAAPISAPAALNPQRVLSYLVRLPLFTRAVDIIIVAFWVLGLQGFWDVKAWGGLVPDKLSFTTAYRINTFPFIHLDMFHAFLNILALTPLMESFEAEHGTLTSIALFIGPLTTIPAIMYVFLERVILWSNKTVMGASIWVFLLLGIEAIRTYRVNPTFHVGSYAQVPTWTTPLVLALLTTFLVPNASFLGHLCGLAVGYLYGLGYLSFLAPPERVLRWIENRLNLLGRLPYYVSVDQRVYGRFGVLPTAGAPAGGVALGQMGPGRRLGP